MVHKENLKHLEIFETFGKFQKHEWKLRIGYKLL